MKNWKKKTEFGNIINDCHENLFLHEFKLLLKEKLEVIADIIPEFLHL